MTVPTKTSAVSHDALVRCHGEEGAWYIEHLRQSSTNRYLQAAIEDIAAEAREDVEAGACGAQALRQDRSKQPV